MKNKIILILTLFVFGFAAKSQTLQEPKLENFQRLAEQKAQDFSEYIAIIASKSTDFKKKEAAIKLALDLFIYDTVTIQISYCPTGDEPVIYSRPIDKYLRKLSMLNYDKVTIEWVDVAIVNDLKKGTDGNYHGIISIVQRFTGVKGELVYQDVTHKNLEVILKPYRKPNDRGEDEWRWDVYLSNVNIVEPCS